MAPCTAPGSDSSSVCGWWMLLSASTGASSGVAGAHCGCSGVPTGSTSAQWQWRRHQQTFQLMRLQPYWCDAAASLVSGSGDPVGAAAAWWQQAVVSSSHGVDAPVTVVVLYCNGWYRRLVRLLRLDSAATDTWTPLVAARLAAAPVMQAVGIVIIIIELIKIMTIIRRKNKNNIDNVK